jgi:hypothetical protein
MEKAMRSNLVKESARRFDDENSVQEFIRTRGVTRCPTACAVRTQAVIADTDRVALTAHAAMLERLREIREAAEAAAGHPRSLPD